MKRTLLTAILSLALSSFISGQNNLQLYKDYHAAFAARDWKKIESLISYDFQQIDWKHKVVNTKESFINGLKNWNGTVGTEWIVYNSEEKDKKVYSSEQDSDPFIAAFFGIAPIFSYTYEFKENQIWKISYDTLPGYYIDEARFNTNYMRFYYWVEEKYPADVRYIANMDDQKKSAQTYLKLIKIWEKENK
jgi:hypothetical protein